MSLTKTPKTGGSYKRHANGEITRTDKAPASAPASTTPPAPAKPANKPEPEGK